MRKINILYVIDYLYGISGGTEKQLFMLINGLSKELFQPYLCCIRNTGWFQQNSNRFNCPTSILDLKSLLSSKIVKRVRELKRLIKEKQIDIVQTFFPDASVLGCLAVKNLNNTILVNSRRNQGYWLSKKRKFIFRSLNRYVDYFLCNSNDTKFFISKTEKIPLAKIHTIHNGIDLTPFARINEALRSTARARLKIPEGAIVIGCVANLRPIKAIHVLIDAFKEFSHYYKGSYCVLVGDGPCRNDLENQCERLGIKDRVIFAGEQEDVIPYLATFDIGVLCSLSESFPNAVLEYQAAGIPTVATDVGGVKEIIDNGNNGVIVSPNDSHSIAKSLIQIVQDKELRFYMIQNARRVVKEKFPIAKMIDRHEGFYKSICKT